MTTPTHEPGTDTPPQQQVVVARGNLYLSRETCESCFPSAEAVALIEREGRVLVMPLMPESGGGLLLKIRNARGDRVIHAQEFFRDKGYAERFEEQRLAAQWRPDLGALLLENLPKSRETAN